MKTRPLALTIFIFGALAFGADAWIARDSGHARLGKGHVAALPASTLASPNMSIAEPAITASDLAALDFEGPVFAQPIVAGDANEVTRSVAQKLRDLSLATQIIKRLFRTRDLRTFDFGVDVTDGVVELAGRVPTELDRQQAERAARGVHGVQSVTNNIQIRP